MRKLLPFDDSYSYSTHRSVVDRVPTQMANTARQDLRGKENNGGFIKDSGPIQKEKAIRMNEIEIAKIVSFLRTTRENFSEKRQKLLGDRDQILQEGSKVHEELMAKKRSLIRKSALIAEEIGVHRESFHMLNEDLSGRLLQRAELVANREECEARVEMLKAYYGSEVAFFMDGLANEKVMAQLKARTIEITQEYQATKGQLKSGNGGVTGRARENLETKLQVLLAEKHQIEEKRNALDEEMTERHVILEERIVRKAVEKFRLDFPDRIADDMETSMMILHGEQEISDELQEVIDRTKEEYLNSLEEYRGAMNEVTLYDCKIKENISEVDEKLLPTVRRIIEEVDGKRHTKKKIEKKIAFIDEKLKEHDDEIEKWRGEFRSEEGHLVAEECKLDQDLKRLEERRMKLEEKNTELRREVAAEQHQKQAESGAQLSLNEVDFAPPPVNAIGANSINSPTYSHGLLNSVHSPTHVNTNALRMLELNRGNTSRDLTTKTPGSYSKQSVKTTKAPSSRSPRYIMRTGGCNTNTLKDYSNALSPRMDGRTPVLSAFEYSNCDVPIPCNNRNNASTLTAGNGSGGRKFPKRAMSNERAGNLLIRSNTSATAMSFLGGKKGNNAQISGHTNGNNRSCYPGSPTTTRQPGPPLKENISQALQSSRYFNNSTTNSITHNNSNNTKRGPIQKTSPFVMSKNQAPIGALTSHRGPMSLIEKGITLYKKVPSHNCKSLTFHPAYHDERPPSVCGYGLRLMRLNLQKEDNPRLEFYFTQKSGVDSILPLHDIILIDIPEITADMISVQQNGREPVENQGQYQYPPEHVAKLKTCSSYPFFIMTSQGETIDLISKNFDEFVAFHECLAPILSSRGQMPLPSAKGTQSHSTLNSHRYNQEIQNNL